MAYSYEIKTGDGATSTFTFSFNYLEAIHLTVLVDGVNTTYTMPTVSSIQLSVAPDNAANVKIKRTTPVETSTVDFVDGSVLGETDLDSVILQLLYVTQEAFDDAADSIKPDAAGVTWDAVSKKIINVANPTSPQDAVTKAYTDTLALAITASEVAAAASAVNSAGSASAASTSATEATAKVVLAQDEVTLATAQVVLATAQAQASAVSAAESLAASTPGGGYFKGDSGAIGNAASDIFRINAKTLNGDVTINANEYAQCMGPLTVAAGVSLTVATGGRLEIRLPPV